MSAPPRHTKIRESDRLLELCDTPSFEFSADEGACDTTGEKLTHTISHANEVSEMVAELEAKWKAFDNMFTDMTKAMLSQVGGAMKLTAFEDDGKEHFDEPEKFGKDAAKVATLLRNAKNCVIYTGAGVSTSSGLPDYRGPNGVWTKEKQAEKGEGNGAFKRLTWAELGKAKPTYSHWAIAVLERLGFVSHVISTNIDGLHLHSGIPRDKLSELHGNCYVELCTKCSKENIRQEPVHNANTEIGKQEHDTDRECSCGGTFRDSIVNFNENLPKQVWKKAQLCSKRADLFIAMGSTLSVSPSNLLPECVVEKKGDLVIVNLQKTGWDGDCSVRVFGYIDKFLHQVMKHLRLEVPTNVSGIRKMQPNSKPKPAPKKKSSLTSTRKPHSKTSKTATASSSSSSSSSYTHTEDSSIPVTELVIPTKFGVECGKWYTPFDSGAVKCSKDKTLNMTQKRAFDIGPASLATPLKKPHPGDWLFDHPSVGQTVERWEQQFSKRIGVGKDTIYLVPFGDFSMGGGSGSGGGEEGEHPMEVVDMHAIMEYVKAYYLGVNVVLADAIPLNLILAPDTATDKAHPVVHQEKREVLYREWDYGKQVYVPNIFKILSSLKGTPTFKNAYCILGVCIYDLFPHFSWNYVFGKASLTEGYGVFSFARYVKPDSSPPTTTPATACSWDSEWCLKRCCQVCVHELGHMFGIKHCVYFNCCMCGSNSLEESERRNCNLCPIDLKKLWLATKCDIVERYSRLQAFYCKHPTVYAKEYEWCAHRISLLTQKGRVAT